MQQTCSDVLIITFHQKYNDVVLASSVERRFINNIATLLERFSIYVVFSTFVTTSWYGGTTLRSLYGVVCLLG